MKTVAALFGMIMAAIGVLLALTGGGCTVFLLFGMVRHLHLSVGVIPFLVVSLVVLGLGVVMIKAGFNMAQGDDEDADPRS